MASDTLLTEIRILILEDNEADYRYAQVLLSGSTILRANREIRYALDRAASIAEGIQALQSKSFDVLLLDLSLPDSDDLAGLHQIQVIAPETPIVIYSGLAEESLAIDALQNGAQDFLFKGCSADLLRRSLHYAIERNNILRELEAERQRAEAAAEAKSEFLANISHEIRTPLTSIIGYADAALVKAGEIEDYLSAIQKIKNNSEHLLHLVNEILDVTKIDADKLVLEPLEISIFQLVDETVLSFLPLATKKDISLTAEYSFPLPALAIVDPTRVRQILINLISNAIKFTERGGVVVAVTFDADAQLLTFEVQDTGLGISADALGNIFEAFTQADTSTTRRFGGTGLGLHLCSKLLKKMDGSISVSSTVGEGSNFSVSIPTAIPSDAAWLDTAPEQPSVESLPSGTVPSLQGTVLIGEDAIDTAELMQELLVAAGVSVRLASTGREVLAQLEQQHFDLILLDMQMPELDGFGVLEALKQKECRIPVMVTTASTSTDLRRRCRALGCQGFLRKPFRWGEFYQSVGRGLQLAAAEPIISELFHERPDFLPLIEQFVGRLPQRLEALEQAVSQPDLSQLAVLAHSLKGAAAYGYPQLGARCEALELAAERGDSARAKQEVDLLRDLVRRIQAGTQRVSV